jgi:hypothetical protein
MAGRTVLGESTDWNLDPQRANELMMEPIFLSENILNSPYVRVKSNVIQEATLSYAGQLSRIIQPNNGCGFDPKGKMPITERTINVKRHKVNLSQCTDEFFDNCWEYITGQGLSIEKLDATALGNQILSFLITRTQQGIVNDMFELGWYADDTSVDPYFAQNNGWFKQINADIVAGDTPPIVPTGSGAPLAAGASETIFAAMFDAQLDVMDDLDEGEKVLLVSRSIYNNYKNFLKDNPNLESARTMLMDGVMELRYCGVLVVKCSQWDRVDANDLGLVDNHRAVLTYRRNLTVGTDITALDNEFVTWFDMKDEVQQIKAKMRLGFQVAHPELLVYGE